MKIKETLNGDTLENITRRPGSIFGRRSGVNFGDFYSKSWAMECRCTGERFFYWKLVMELTLAKTIKERKRGLLK